MEWDFAENISNPILNACRKKSLEFMLLLFYCNTSADFIHLFIYLLII